METFCARITLHTLETCRAGARAWWPPHPSGALARRQGLLWLGTGRDGGCVALPRLETPGMPLLLWLPRTCSESGKVEEGHLRGESLAVRVPPSTRNHRYTSALTATPPARMDTEGTREHPSLTRPREPGRPRCHGPVRRAVPGPRPQPKAGRPRTRARVPRPEHPGLRPGAHRLHC